jgi:hypothetical protein
MVRAMQSGNNTFAAAESVERTITFVAGALSPFITNPPADQTVPAGETAIFRATAIGTPAPTYQWQKDNVVIANATTSVLTLSSTTLADTGRYTVTATNLAGTSTASATLTVRAAPVLTTLPESTTAPAGGSVTFTAAATGFPAPTFQWRKNGAAIAGATNGTLRFASVATTDAGRYDVVATNALGSETSAAATLTVTTRDFSGTYFGLVQEPSPDAPGEVALLVRREQPAIVIARLTSGTAIATTAAIDFSGNFSASAVAMGTPLARTITIRGTIDETTGQFSAAFASDTQRWTVAGVRAGGPGGAANRAGYYAGAHEGTSTGRCFAIVAPDGDTLIVYGSNLGAVSTRAVLDAAGRLTGPAGITPPSFDVTFNNGVMNGTMRVVQGGAILGAIEALAGTERLVNLSVRTTNNNAAPLITGFVISGAAPKQVLLRAAGPAIGQAPFNVPGVLADPTLQVFRGNNMIAQNDEWGTPAANGAAVTAAATRAGAFPFRAGSTDAALVTTLTPTAYTVQIGGGNGAVLAEVYEVLENNETTGARRLVNLSARGLVTPAAPMIAGFVIGGTVPHRVLIRAIGPTLGQAPFNVAGALPNPQLTLRAGNTNTGLLRSNDDWFRETDATLIREAAARAGAFALPAQSADAAVLLYLAPGAYTAQVNGPTNANQQNGTGIVLIEVYESIP